MRASLLPLMWRTIVFKIGLILLAMTLALGAMVIYFANLQSRYEAEGQVTPGILIDKYIETTRDSDGDTRTSYYIVYRFRPSGDQMRQGRDSISSGTYYELLIDQQIEIEYLPADPQINRLAGTGGWLGVYIFSGVSGALGVASLVLLVLALRSALRKRQLRQRGLLRTAQVVTIHPSNTTVNGRRLYHLTYQYVGDDGVSYQGTSEKHPYEHFDTLEPGNFVEIYVDRSTPRMSAWSTDVD